MNEFLEMRNKLFGEDFLGFGFPTRIKFDTLGTKDMSPITLKKWKKEASSSDEIEEKGYKIVCRTIGIDEKDVTVSIKDYGICVDGKTTIDIDGEIETYSQHVELPIAKDILNNIEKIRYYSKDGLTYIFLITKMPQQSQIDIEKINK